MQIYVFVSINLLNLILIKNQIKKAVTFVKSNYENHNCTAFFFTIIVYQLSIVNYNSPLSAAPGSPIS